jgi:tRNA1Val (adenine37-N6)-methyltransferase
MKNSDLQMPNNYFDFKQFSINQEMSAFKVGTDGVLLGACADLSGARRIIDAGTGTGLIAIMVAQRCTADIVAIEPDKDSWLEACQNIINCKWHSRIKAENLELQEFAARPTEKFDIVISNPPYFRDSLLNPDIRKSSARHTYSLSSGDILKASETLLREEGNLQLILPYEEGTLFIAEAGDYGFFCNTILKVKPNPQGKIIRLILKFERRKKTVYEKFLTIETGVRHMYSKEYKEITKDFYL